MRIDWQVGQKLPVTIVLRKTDGSGNAVVCQGEGKVIAGDAQGQYKLDFDLETSSDAHIDESWSMAGIIGGKMLLDETTNNPTNKLSFKVDTLYKGNNELEIPVAFSWIVLKRENVISSHEAQAHNVSFTPLGTLISLDIISEAFDPVEVAGVKIKTNLFTNKGYFDLNAKPTAGKTLPFVRDNASANVETFSYVISTKDASDANALRLTTDQHLKGLYAWVMATPSTTTDKVLKIGFELKPTINMTALPQIRSGYGEGVNGEDTPAPCPNHTTPEINMWEPRNISIVNINNGRPQTLRPRITPTEPIITEVYRPKISSQSGINSENRVVVEIYNPTKKTIDLSNYYFVRIRDWGAVVPLIQGNLKFILGLEMFFLCH